MGVEIFKVDKKILKEFVKNIILEQTGREKLDMELAPVTKDEEEQLAIYNRNYNNISIMVALAKNPNLHYDAQFAIFMGGPRESVVALAENPNSHPNVLEWVVSGIDKYEINKIIAARPDITKHAQKILINRNNKDIWTILANNPNIDDEIAKELLFKLKIALESSDKYF